MKTDDPFRVDVVEYYRTRPVITEPDGQHKYALSGEGVTAVYQCGISFAPAKESERWNMCAGKSAGCEMACLITAGQNQWPSSKRARVLRTRLLMEQPEAFLRYLERDLARARKRAAKLGLRFAFRFNTLSDADAMRIAGHLVGEGDIWLDYTKIAGKYRAWLKSRVGERVNGYDKYHLTFSRSEKNMTECLEFLKLGGTCTVVMSQDRKDQFIKGGWPFHGFPCVDGDLSDRRWEDPPGHWVVLVAKGKAKRDTTGFVVR